jgi:hypothetical protein
VSFQARRRSWDLYVAQRRDDSDLKCDLLSVTGQRQRRHTVATLSESGQLLTEWWNIPRTCEEALLSERCVRPVPSQQ